MNKLTRIHIPPLTGLAMISNYAGIRIREQLKAVAFIVLYLVAFQILVLGTAPANAFRVSAGIGMVVLGLAMFLEGLILGLMPLGERVGLKLPQRGGLGVIIFFGLLLGFGSTLAEPAVAALRVFGSAVKAWNAPLLYKLLENDPEKLVVAIGIGVGIAVAAGMVRLYYGISIKPFVYFLVPTLLALSLFCAMDDNLAALLGLAWDAGAVTTGAVTVPLVLALGIGVARNIGKHNDGSGGFGIIMLASAFPVLTVLALGIMINQSTPRAMPQEKFFAPEQRQEVMKLFSSEKDLLTYAYQHGNEAGRKAFHANPDTHLKTVQSLADPVVQRIVLGDMPLSDWLHKNASDQERTLLQEDPAQSPASVKTGMLHDVLGRGFTGALRSVIPLTALLLATLALFLRDRVKHNDEVMLGIAMSLVGMALLTSGIQFGLVPLGDEAGRTMPYLLSSKPHEEARIHIKPFNTQDVFHIYDANGHPGSFFHFRTADGKVRIDSFDPDRYDTETRHYEHIFRRNPIFSQKTAFIGIGLVLLFAFGMGYGSTLAEPALSALGHKVEEISVGTIKRIGVVRAVSFGVGFGMIAGTARILYDLPTLWLITPPYLLLLWLTKKSEKDFAGIAWDCGGVTTGVVTVPLVMAMGLGIGAELNVVDGFGTLAMASVYPVVTVMIYGLVIRARQRRSIQAGVEEEENNE